jgi:hypothetical protein
VKGWGDWERERKKKGIRTKKENQENATTTTRPATQTWLGFFLVFGFGF